MKSIRWIGAMLVGVTLSTPIACRKNVDSGSEVLTLDNFTRSGESKLHMNTCGAGDSENADDAFVSTLLANDGYVKWTDESQKAALMPQLASALKSVPPVLHIAFFGMGGSFEMTSSAPSLCAKKHAGADGDLTFFGEGTGTIHSCWDEVMKDSVDTDGNAILEEGFVVYVNPDEQSIQHSIVRSFGHMMAEHLHKFDLDESENGVVRTHMGDQAFGEFKMNLAEKLLLDLLQQKPGTDLYDLSHYRSMLSQEVQKARSGEAMTAAWRTFTTTDPSKAQKFGDFVFAESFDSFYCSTETRAAMESDYSGVYGEFAAAAAAIEEMRAQLPAVNEEADINNAEALKNASASGEGSQVGLTLVGFGIFRGIGRAVGAVARGIGRIGRGIVRGIGAVGRAVVRGAGVVIRGAARIAGAVIRGTGRVILRLGIGAARLAGGIIRAGARVIGGLARGAVALGAWVIRGSGRVVHGLFGPFARLNGCYGYSCGRSYSSRAFVDTDGDGIDDRSDQCLNTVRGAKVHRIGTPYAGCSAGQKRDIDLVKVLESSGYDPNGDIDQDGIPNDQDLCSNTAKGNNVHKSGDWIGCGYGQSRDRDVLNRYAGAAR